MLSDKDLWSLSKKMNVPLEQVVFKDELKKPLKYNKSYIINMEDAKSKDGKKNAGTHWVCFQVNQYNNGKKEGIYFDSYGVPPPTSVQKFVGGHIPHNERDIQSLMNSACGWYCMAFLHFINASPVRSGDLYSDANHFIHLFNDLEKNHDHIYNEYVLKHFFRSADPTKRKPVEIKGENVNPENIITQDEDYR